MAITKCLIPAPSVNRFTVAARALRECGLRVDGGMVRPIWKQERLNMNTPEKAENRELADSELDQVNGGAIPLIAVALIGFSVGFTGATLGYEAASAYLRS